MSLQHAAAQEPARRAGVGLYNIVRWDWTILRAVSPHYWVLFLVREGQGGWRLLGSIVLCITGARCARARQARAALRREAGAVGCKRGERAPQSAPLSLGQ